MPRKYVRKVGAKPRGMWTEEALLAAFEELRQKKCSINEISRQYGIPSRTLRRRFAKQDTKKITLGKHPVLDFDNEKRLVAHVQKLEAAGFPITRDMLRRLAFEFAEKLVVKHNFDKETRKAGPHWLQSFLERHSELSVRQAEGLSVARVQGLNRKEVDKMFKLLLQILTKHDLINKPDRIFNIDETGVQLNNKPGKVIATKGAKSVHSVTSGEKGETVSIVACCNAAGNFLPPVVIIKGVNKKPEFQDGLPPGSEVYMNKKSAYINAELFQKWLIQHFVPRKPQGKVILVLDGACGIYPYNPAAIPESFFAISDLSNGVCNEQENVSNNERGGLLDPSCSSPTLLNLEDDEIRVSPTLAQILSSTPPNLDVNHETSGSLNTEKQNLPDSPSLLSAQQSGPSSFTGQLDAEIEKETPSKHLQEYSPIPKIPVPLYKRGKQSAAVLTSEENIIARKNKGKATSNLPCKKSKQPRKLTKKRARASSEKTDGSSTCASDDSSKENESYVSVKNSKYYRVKKLRLRKTHQTKNVNTQNTMQCPVRKAQETKGIGKVFNQRDEHSNESDSSQNGGNECVECFEDFAKTKSKVDWIQCVMCKNWLHETCTMYGDYCNQCQRLKLRHEKKKLKI
ncbi:hypothetical protein K1T71_004713 [Dendrolimus kikuchii]|uniref:Uncharacterized protein n=1 Tax=Dendrolimus kikuchii TaxID=765133 RepID=A0ACC1D8C4_9NEOP|nr:hypothetical protein K1T71_004713 [Dendrolimus kikuchii]